MRRRDVPYTRTKVDVGNEHREEHDGRDHHQHGDAAAGATFTLAPKQAGQGHQLLSSAASELLTSVVSLSA